MRNTAGSLEAGPVVTCFGCAGIVFVPKLQNATITASIELALRETPAKIFVRFRHPEKTAIKSVSVNGKPHTRFNATSGDVDITGYSGAVEVVAQYAVKGQSSGSFCALQTFLE